LADYIATIVRIWIKVEAFPDMRIVVKNRIATDEQVAVEVEFTGTNSGPLQIGPDVPPIPATGKQISNKGAYFARIRDGKGVEVHTYPDAAGMMIQLGLVPPPGG
jgi:predicted ester cyclase